MNWTKAGRVSLENQRDVLARMGFRYLWVTVGYYAIAWLVAIDPFGPRTSRPFSGMFVAVMIPLAGGIIDWCRLRLRRQRS